MAVRRCPECGTVNRPTVPVCECGFVFDAVHAQAIGVSGASDLAHETPEDQRHYHMHRLTLGWFAIAGFVVILLASVALLVLGSRLMILPTAASFALLFKGARMIGTARRGLRGLAAADAKLPKAKLLER